MSGYTFNPHDSELINYLNNKITGKNLGGESEINEVNICHYEPADIPGLARMESAHTWHVISPVEKLNGRCERTKRSSKTGHWKITGKNLSVKDVDGNTIGFKKILVFHNNKKTSSSSSSASASAQQDRFTWVIHEFHSSIQHPNKDAFVLCKLMKKKRSRQRESMADTFPVATVTSPILTPDPQTYNDDIVVGDYFDGLEDFVPEFQSSDWCI